MTSAHNAEKDSNRTISSRLSRDDSPRIRPASDAPRGRKLPKEKSDNAIAVLERIARESTMAVDKEAFEHLIQNQELPSEFRRLLPSLRDPKSTLSPTRLEHLAKTLDIPHQPGEIERLARACLTQLDTETLEAKLARSRWSVSYNLLMEEAPPFGHNFITVNEHVTDDKGQEHIYIRTVAGYVGGLFLQDFFGLWTKRAKVFDEARRIEDKNDIEQISWKVTHEQMTLLLAQINHDRQSSPTRVPPVHIPDPNSKELTEKDKARIKKYEERHRIKTRIIKQDRSGNPILGVDGKPAFEEKYIVDNPNGPRYSVIGNNCKCYSLWLLKLIGIDEAALYDLFIQIPLCGHKLKPAKILTSEPESKDFVHRPSDAVLPTTKEDWDRSRDATRTDGSAYFKTHKWDPILFKASLQNTRPFQRNFFEYYTSFIGHTLKRSWNTFKSLGMKQLCFMAASTFLAITALSLILLSTMGIGALPTSVFIMQLLGSNAAVSFIAGTALLIAGCYGTLTNSLAFKELWAKTLKRFASSKEKVHSDPFTHLTEPSCHSHPVKDQKNNAPMLATKGQSNTEPNLLKENPIQANVPSR